MPTNKERASIAEQAVEMHDHFLSVTKSPFRTQIIDLVTNLRHLCRSKAIPFEAVLATSSMHYGAETAEEDDRNPDSIVELSASMVRMERRMNKIARINGDLEHHYASLDNYCKRLGERLEKLEKMLKPKK